MYMLNLVLDPEYQFLKNLEPMMLNRNLNILNTRATKDPDSPNIGEAMNG